MVKSEQILGLLDWLHRFRRKLIFMALLPLLAAVAVYFYADWVIQLISRPIEGLSLYFMTPVEGFTARVKVALGGGLVLACPFLVYLGVSLFTTRASRRKKFLLYMVVVPAILILFGGGLVFGYFLVLPATIGFLVGCGNEFMEPMLMGSSYFSFVIILLLCIGLIFELPVVMILLSRIGLVKSDYLQKQRRVVIMLILVVTAVITPTPDAFTLLLVAVPLVILYELSIWCIYLLERFSHKRLNQGEESVNDIET